MTSVLETERLRLRPLRDSDAAPFSLINLDPAVMEFFPATLPPEKTAQYIKKAQRHLADHGFSKWAIERRDTGDFIGITGVVTIDFDAPFSHLPEIGWRVSSAHWGQGFATEAARRAIEDVFERFDFPEIVAFTAASNTRSRRVMEKLGMRHDGEFDHPKLPTGHALQRHLLYRLGRPQ